MVQTTHLSVMEMIQEFYQLDLKDPWGLIDLELTRIPLEAHIDFANRNLLKIADIDSSNEWRKMMYKRLETISKFCALFISELYKDNFTAFDATKPTDIMRVLLDFHYYIEHTRILLVEVIIKYGYSHEDDDPNLDTLRERWEKWIQAYLNGYSMWWQGKETGVITTNMDSTIANYCPAYGKYIEMERIELFDNKDFLTELMLYTKQALDGITDKGLLFGFEFYSLKNEPDLIDSCLIILRILYDFSPHLILNIMSSFGSAIQTYGKIDKRVSLFVYFTEILDHCLDISDPLTRPTRFTVN